MLIEQKDLQIVLKIIKNNLSYDVDVWAFGSRVHGENLKKFSDLDLALDGGGNKIDDNFRLIIEKNREKL